MSDSRVSVRRLSPLVRVVTASNPSPMTLEGTNTYLVGDAAPIVIDPGPSIDEHLDAVLAEAGEPSRVLLTHSHPDHAEGAGRFAEAARAPLAMWGGRGDAAVRDGDRIETGGVTLVAVYTPGHSADHVCFLLEQERALFTGDHVLGRGTSVIAWPEGDVGDYVDSLERTRAIEAAVLYPGHGPVIDDPKSVLDYYIRHRVEREGEVLAAVGDGLDEIGSMVKRIYAAYDPALHGAAALSVRAHLEKLRREGIVQEQDGRWLKAR